MRPIALAAEAEQRRIEAIIAAEPAAEIDDGLDTYDYGEKRIEEETRERRENEGYVCRR